MILFAIYTSKPKGFAPLNIKSHDYVAPTNENYYFSAVIEMSADYHEFGMNMEGRGFSGSLNYRFGYQGSEKDNEVNSSNGSSYTTEFRQLDTRLGRWFSSDPVFQPWQSSYTSMDNNPVNLTDVLGDVAGDNKGKIKEYLAKNYIKIRTNSRNKLVSTNVCVGYI